MKRPRIKIKLEPMDKIVEVIGMIGLLLLSERNKITSTAIWLLLRLFSPLKTVIYPDKRPFSREKLSAK